MEIELLKNINDQNSTEFEVNIMDQNEVLTYVYIFGGSKLELYEIIVF